ncbi:hypothetical protein VQ056_02080 [Paenibacillus sp. JTLBN-2024]
MSACSPIDLNIGDPDAVLKKHEMIKGAIEGKLTPDQLSPEMQGHLERWNKYKADPKANIGEWGPPYAYLVGGQPMADVKFWAIRGVFAVHGHDENDGETLEQSAEAGKRNLFQNRPQRAAAGCI